MSHFISNLPKIKGQYRESIKVKTWFDVGGVVDVLFRPLDINDLCYFLQNCPGEIPINIIGAGSNIIIGDEGVRGVLIKLPPHFSNINHQDCLLNVGAATLCGNVALYCRNHSLSNLEFFCGIPGSIGGAIAMNAGCYDGDVSKYLISVTAIDYKGNRHILKKSDFEFAYRENKLAKDFIFVDASFEIKHSTPLEVSNKIDSFTAQRETNQPIRAKTGGSTFKNPKNCDKKAWQLIDEAGCRGKIVGGAKISEKHCNFMINFDNALASDLIRLGDEVKQEVKKNSGIDLEWEIKIIK